MYNYDEVFILIEVIVVSIIWLVNTLVELFSILNMLKKKEDSRKDNYPIIVAMCLWESILTILCLGVIIQEIIV